MILILILILIRMSTFFIDARAKNAGSESLQDLMDMLSNPALWSSLHYADACPFVDMESFGLAQPVVRTSAWSLLLVLLQHWKGVLFHDSIAFFTESRPRRSNGSIGTVIKRRSAPLCVCRTRHSGEKCYVAALIDFPQRYVSRIEA